MPAPNTIPSVAVNMPAPEYHAITDHISKHGLDKIRRAPALFKYEQDNPPERTEAMRWGGLVHTFVLEPDKFTSETVVGPNRPRPTKAQRNAKKPAPETLELIAFWDGFDREHAGKEVVSADEVAELRLMRDAVYAHPAAHKILDCGDPRIEHSLFWQDADTGVRCRSRPDFWRPDMGHLIVDLKTTSDGRSGPFTWDCLNYRYHVQASMYLDAVRAVTGEEPRGFVFICVEKNPPYLVSCYAADSEMIIAGASAYLGDLFTYRKCLETGEWPGYSQLIETISMPAGLASQP